MSDTVEIRLFGGPIDGEVHEVSVSLVDEWRQGRAYFHKVISPTNDMPSQANTKIYAYYQYPYCTEDGHLAIAHINGHSPECWEDEVLKYINNGVPIVEHNAFDLSNDRNAHSHE